MAMIVASNLPPVVRSVVESEVGSDERVLWIEQPIPGLLARTAIPMALFAVPFTAFAVFWIVMALWTTSSAPGAPGSGAQGAGTQGPAIMRIVFPLFGVPFLLAGVWMLSSPLWVRRSAARSVYVLTDRRAIIIRGGRWGAMDVRSFEPAALTDLRRQQRADGSGDLIFASELSIDEGPRPRGSFPLTAKNVGFLAISDVRGVEAMMREMVETHRRDAGGRPEDFS